MKICWTNLENIIHLGNGIFRNKKHKYFIISKCKMCYMEYLGDKYSNSLYCSDICRWKSPEVKNKISMSNKGKIVSEETRKKFSRIHKGKKLSKITIEKIKKWNKDNKEIHRKKTIEGMKKLRIKDPNFEQRRLNGFLKKSLGSGSHFWKGGVIENNIPCYDTYAHQISYCEKVRKNKEDQNILEVKCAYCGKWFIPTRINIMSRIQSLNGQSQGECRLYCSDNCKQECPIYWKQKYSAEESNTKRYSREVQPELRQLVFERDNYTCQKCGKHQNELDCGLHCHHKEGILWKPLESADIDESITFCKDCHIEVHKLPDCGLHDMRCA